MDNLEVAICLIEDAKAELTRLLAYETAIDALPLPENCPDYWERRYQIDRIYSPIPHRQTINDNLKVARRLLLKEYI